MIVPDFPDVEGFNWDFANVHKLLKRHNVSTIECEQAFFNEPFLMYEDTEHSIQKLRYYFLGVTNEYRHLTIIFTIRERKIRPLSAAQNYSSYKYLASKRYGKCMLASNYNGKDYSPNTLMRKYDCQAQENDQLGGLILKCQMPEGAMTTVYAESASSCQMALRALQQM